MADQAEFERLQKLHRRTVRKVEVLENLIEEKTRALYQANQSLEQANDELEQRVDERTDELARALRVATEANRAKAEFLANTSHELRTPLHGMLGVAEYLVGTTQDPKQEEALDLILRSGRQLVELINSVLDFEKLDAQKFELELLPFSPRDLVHHVVWLFRERAKEKGVALEAELGLLPPFAVGDELRLTQVLGNLVSNAVKFTTEGSVTLRAKCLDPETQDELHSLPSVTSSVAILWQVKDTGPGIDERRRQSLFEPFEQAEKSTARMHGGTGLGLAICKGFVELMGSQIILESTVDEGSNFCFTTIHQLAPTKVTSVVPDLPAADGILTLVVDDNGINRKVAKMMLTRLGCEVEVATSAKDALELAAQQPFDLIFMDCHMPIVDGYRATQELLSRLGTACPPIIGLSATSDRTKEKCLQAGMSDFIQKPANLKALSTALENWAGREDA
ncbi:MAG: ATP-binding protein [Polyangiaceae bacterium]|nr:ATP-binding protein [Polyangiaceae bacterium]